MPLLLRGIEPEGKSDGVRRSPEGATPNHLGSFFRPTGVHTQGVGPDLLVKSNFTFGFVW
jgi:hypothetical protein